MTGDNVELDAALSRAAGWGLSDTSLHPVLNTRQAPSNECGRELMEMLFLRVASDPPDEASVYSLAWASASGTVRKDEQKGPGQDH